MFVNGYELFFFFLPGKETAGLVDGTGDRSIVQICVEGNGM